MHFVHRPLSVGGVAEGDGRLEAARAPRVRSGDVGALLADRCAEEDHALLLDGDALAGVVLVTTKKVGCLCPHRFGLGLGTAGVEVQAQDCLAEIDVPATLVHFDDESGETLVLVLLTVL